MNVEILNLILIAINIFWGIFYAHKVHYLSSAEKYASILIDSIFKPFYSTIECNLFIKIQSENRATIIGNLQFLYLTLKENDLTFYISDSLLISLENIIETQSEEKVYSDNELNNLYQVFSKSYYAELNRFRRIVGLKGRTPNFRIHHKLYKYQIQTLLMNYLEYEIVFLVVLIQLLLLWLNK